MLSAPPIMHSHHPRPDHPTRVDIGIFAHNEAKTVAHILNEMRNQDFQQMDFNIILLANGCTDDTVKIAHEVNMGLASIADLPEPGKSRTWNQFVHRLSRPDADFLIFMDADIELPNKDSIARMVDALKLNAKLWAFNSHPIKDIIHYPQGNLGVIDKMIVAGSETLGDWKSSICGSLYAMPAQIARRFHMPIGLAVEDGFLRAMILTDAFTGQEDFSRIDGGEIFHIFKSERKISRLVRHQTRLIIGSAVNTAIFSFFEKVPNHHKHQELRQAAHDERWLSRTLQEQLPRWPYGWVPLHYLTKRIQNILQRPSEFRKPRKIFALTGGFMFDLVVYVNAQIKMARGVGAGHW